MTQIVKTESLQKKIDAALSKTNLPKPSKPIDVQMVNSSRIPEIYKDLIPKIFNYPMVMDYPKQVLKCRIMIAMNKTIIFVGYTVKDLELCYQETYKYIQEFYRFVTIEEIEYAFERGRMDEYGEWHGISARTFCMWIKQYIKENKSKAINYAEKLLKSTNKKEMDKAIKLEIERQWVQCWIKDYKSYSKCKDKHMLVTDTANKFYEYLNKIQLLVYGEDELKEFYGTAKLNVIEKKRLKSLSYPMGRLGLKNDIEKIKEEHPSMIPLIEFEQKRIILKDFLKVCKDSEVDFENMIKEAVISYNSNKNK